MALDENILEKLRLKHGKVQPVPYHVPGKQPGIIVVRKPTFSEYILFNKYAEAIDGDNYELDPEVTDIYLQSVIVFPENIQIQDIPAGVIVKACTISIKLSEFEDIEKMRDLYIKSIRSFNTQAGALLAKLIAAYGIQGYQLTKGMQEEEIIDLLVASETITNTYGDFAKITNLPDMPFVPRTKKLDVDRILGIRSKEDPINKMPENKKSRLTAYYKSLNYSDEQIQSIIDKIESGETKREFERNKPAYNDKIDINALDDSELSKMTARDFNDLKKQGKIMSPTESQERLISDAKQSLTEKIAEDKVKFGTRESKMPSADMQKLLSQVNSIIKTMD